MKYPKKNIGIIFLFVFYHISSFSQTIFTQINIDSNILKDNYDTDSLSKKLLTAFIYITNKEIKECYTYQYDFEIVDSDKEIPQNSLSIKLSIRDKFSHTEDIIEGEFLFLEKDEVIYKTTMAYKAKKDSDKFTEVLKTTGGDIYSVGEILKFWCSMSDILDVYPTDEILNYNIDETQLDTLKIERKRFKNVLCLLETEGNVEKYTEWFYRSVQNILTKTQRKIFNLQQGYYNVYFIKNKKILNKYRKKYPEAIEVYCNLKYLGKERYQLSQQIQYYTNGKLTSTDKQQETLFEEDLKKYPIYSMVFFSFYDDLKAIFNK